ncbi:tetratricopeptide (TPR) repeat protein [Rhodanobacter sp. ANJX3]|uniref:tetratricopeptide repeat-containing sulfotransferase family protein n=1 Tax=Rhodanobacter sp. ANJX3 TaxID=2723083 RepID=UPI0016207574|nr:sulfotransferase [Rhodanobacter sp. ANJX3]MBB5359865.1 tetratricopeptide (TPR) repeat protein [Rhodanobacter sp. ANJX3]
MINPSELYAELVTAFRAGRWRDADTLASKLLPVAQNHAGVYGIAGVACMELQQMDQATEYLERASAIDPTRADFATLHAKALSATGQWNKARTAAERALSLSPDDPATLDTLGIIFAKAQAHGKAVEAFEQAINIAPAKASLHFNLATSLIALGCVDAAESELQKTIATDARYWQAHLSLAHITRQTPEQNHIKALRSLMALNPADVEAGIHLNMALAKEYEDLSDYQKAFDHLSLGKAALKRSRPYSSARDASMFDNLMRAFPITESVTAGHPTKEPIFIMGMPRSGTSLAERILTSHQDVYSAGELQNFAMALQRASGNGGSFLHSYEKMAAAAENLDWQSLGDDYLNHARPLNRDETYFVDKLPHNFLYAGFIAKALPNAKIICVRRNPMDTCISNFRQLFDRSTSTFDYSADLLDTGRYYLKFRQLMAHWQQAFPGRILEIHYEDLVNDLEATSRQMLEFCALPWDDTCLSFENNPAPVATFSSLQVRRPIYRSSLTRWKSYETQAEALKKLLVEAGVDFSV